MFRFSGAAAACAVLALAPVVVPVSGFAQSNPGWFVPKSQGAGAGSGSASGAPAHRGHHAAAAATAASTQAPMSPSQAAAGPPPVLPLPPVPPVGQLPKGAPPPAAVTGVISVPDIMRNSTAAGQVQKVLGARRDRLQADVQKEQMVWRDMQQSLQDSKGQSAEQIRGRERALQERVINAQREFKNRERIIQEAAQVALGQIERELVQVIRQVAASKGMNLVLHQEQVALNVQGFDITQEVSNQLNAVLPSVFIPADGVDPEQLAKQGTFPTTANLTANGGAPVPNAGGAPAPAASAGK